MVAICVIENFGNGWQTKSAYESTNAGATWARVPHPGDLGYVDTVTAVSPNDWVISQDRARFQVSVDGGRTWRPESPVHTEAIDGVGATQAVGHEKLVALPDYYPDRYFLTSRNGGLSWNTYQFPKWRITHPASAPHQPHNPPSTPLWHVG